MVRFDNGEEKECSLNILKVEHIAASFPPDVPIPVPENVRKGAILNAAIGEMEQDVEETEDLPARRPEEDELEHEEFTIPNQQTDCEGRMSGQLPTAEQSIVKDYHSIKRASREKIAGLVGHEVTMGNRSSGTMKWKVITNYEPPDECLLQDISTRKEFGLKNFSTMNHKRSEVLAEIFLNLMFMDWRNKVDKMNQWVDDEKCKCRKFTKEEFLIGLALIIGAAEFSQKGVDLFGNKELTDEDDDDLWHSISASPHFEQYMP